MKTLEFDEFRLCLQTRKLSKLGGDAVPLTPRIFDLLLALVESEGRVMTKAELLSTVWSDCIVEESNLSQSVFVLRRALGESAQSPRFIKTIPNQGYKFVAEVRLGAEMTGEPLSVIPSISREQSSPGHLETQTTEGVKSVPLTNKLTPLVLVLRQKAMLLFSIASIIVFLVAGSFWIGQTGTHSRKAINSLAILPFENRTGDINYDFVSDGLYENLTNRLSSLSNLKVVSRTAVAKYNRVKLDPIRAGSEFGVGAVLCGYITSENDYLNIHLELVDTSNGVLLWGESYKRKLPDLLGVQEEVASRVPEKLNLQTSSEERGQLAKRYTENQEAYELYSRGRFFAVKRRSKQDFQKAIDLYERALELDPNYALAYAGIANAYSLMSAFEFGAAKDAFPKAREAALRAIEIDNSLAEGHLALAWIKFCFDWDWLGAEFEFKKSIELNPDIVNAHAQYAVFLNSRGRFEEALLEANRAQEIDSLGMENGMGTAFYLQRRYDEAIAKFHARLERTPDSQSHWWLWQIYSIQGREAEALNELRNAAETIKGENPDSKEAKLVNANFGRGYRQVLIYLLRLELRRSKYEYVSPYTIAKFYMFLQERERAIKWLEQGFEQRAESMACLAVDPMWDNLRAEPRFYEILKKMNLENVRPQNLN